MPCIQSATNGGGAPSFAGPFKTEADCLKTCAEGACCEGDVCTVRRGCECQGAGQVFKGVGTTCTPNPCAPGDPTATGACCVGTVCSVKTQADCTADGGAWKGKDTKCSTYPCTSGCETPGSSCECWCTYDGGTVPNYCNVTVSGWAKRANGPQMQFSDSISVPLKSRAGSCPQWWLNDWMTTDADYAGAATKGLRVSIGGFVGTITSLAFNEAELTAGFTKAIDGSAFVIGSTPSGSTTQTGDWAPVRADAGVKCWRSLAGKWFRNEGVTAGYPSGDSFQYEVRFQVNGFA